MYQKNKQEYERILKEIEVLERRIAAAPAGGITISHEGGGIRFKQYLNGKRLSIGKNESLVKALMRKRYDCLLLNDLRKEAEALKAYFALYPTESEARAFASAPEVTGLLFGQERTNYHDWANEKYPSSAGYPEALVIKTIDGKMVRSKSEAIIYEQLKNYGIPFRYECDLNINGHVICPDFTTRKPADGRRILWEHYGRMDDPDYRRRNLPKIELYAQAGYILGQNLIITTETKDSPFTAYDAVKVIKEYYL